MAIRMALVLWIAGGIWGALLAQSAPPARINLDDLGRLPAFSHATVLGDVVFVSGTLGTEGGTLNLAPGGVGPQTTQTLRNIERILVGAGSSLGQVAKCNVFLTDMSQFDQMNKAYLSVFGNSPPARTTTNSPTLALGAAVEIECVAARLELHSKLAESRLEAPRLEKPRLEKHVKQQIGTVEHDGETIYYEVTGEGEPVVLSHGAGGNHAIWYQQVLVLAQKYQVVTWDQRSFGRTSNRAGLAGPEVFASDLEALLDHLDIDSAHLVGQSMGGWTTVRFAVDHPERVRSIVLADTPGGIMTPEVREDTARLGPDALAAQDLAAWEHPAVGATTSRENPEKAFLYRQIGSVAPPREPAIAQRLFAVDYLDQAKQLEIPVLLIVGNEDQLFTPKAIRSVANALQNSRVAEIPGAGHSPYFETPDRWNEIVLEFLGGLQP